jgi:DNA-entry nuclease
MRISEYAYACATRASSRLMLLVALFLLLGAVVSSASAGAGGAAPAGTAIAAADDAAAATTYVYITNTGKKYHRGDCRYLKKSKIKVTLEDAKRRGYTPCKVCKPPT